MNSPRSLEACQLLGILPDSLYYIDFKTYLEKNPEIIRFPKEIQKIRFDKINSFREETIELVKKKRQELIEEMENESTNKKEEEEELAKKPKKKEQNLNLEKMLNVLREKEEKEIEKIKQKQKNEIFYQIEKKLKNKIIISKNDMRDQRVKKLHNEIKENMQKRAALEEQKQKITEINRRRLYMEKIEQFEKYNAAKHEGEARQLEKLESDGYKKQREKEEMQKKKSDDYEERLRQTRIKVKEARQKIINSIEKKREYTLKAFNNLMEEREKKLKIQKLKNEKKFIKMKEQLKIQKKMKEETNEKSVNRQERYQKEAIKQKNLLYKTMKKRALSQSVLFEENQKRKEEIQEELLKKYNKIEEDMREKQKKIERDKEKKAKCSSVRQADEYLKQFKKEQIIGRLERINIYNTEKRNELLLLKEKKMEDFKRKKNELIQSKAELTDKMEKEKEKLISDFEKSFKKKEQVDANELIEELFPEGKQLSEKDTELKKKIEKLIQQMNKYNNSNESHIMNDREVKSTKQENNIDYSNIQ